MSLRLVYRVIPVSWWSFIKSDIFEPRVISDPLQFRDDVLANWFGSTQQPNRPAYMQQLNGRYFNFDRLGIAYINENLLRLRQAYAEFVLEP